MVWWRGAPARGRMGPAVAVALTAASVLLTLATVFTTSGLAVAGTALLMGGNSHPLSIPQDTTAYISGYVSAADDAFIAPSGLCGIDCALVAVYTPEEIRFATGLFDMTFDESVAVGGANLNDCVQGAACTVTLSPYTETGSRSVSDDTYVIYGYSQSATIAGYQKLQLIAHPVDSTVSFLLIANPNRPNGGILERFVGAYLPFFGVTFNGATPTFSPQPRPLTTVDIARQYDGWADSPTNPLNLLSDLNALMGTILLHPDYPGVGTPQLQGQYQDSTYYLVPTPITPLLLPLTWIPLVGKPLALALDPATRVLVEMGYDRTINPGQPTPARYLYVPNLIRTARSFAVAIPTGWDDAISYLARDPDCRPFHTTVPTSPYGVGGPPVYTGAIDPYGDPTPYLEPPTPAASEVVASAPEFQDYPVAMGSTRSPVVAVAPSAEPSTTTAEPTDRDAAEESPAEPTARDSSPRDDAADAEISDSPERESDSDGSGADLEAERTATTPPPEREPSPPAANVTGALQRDVFAEHGPRLTEHEGSVA